MDREEEAERIRRAPELEAERRRAELEEQLRRERVRQEEQLRWEQERLEEERRLERERVEALLQEAADWQQSNNLRAYLREVEARKGRIEEGGELAQWLAWAREQADRLDPLSRKVAAKEECNARKDS